MVGQAHVVYIGIRMFRFWQGYLLLPKTEIVDAVGAFGNGKE